MSRADVAAIVLVDDDLLALELLRDLVSSIPATAVHAFGRSEEALGWCQSHQPDLVITDHVMPGLTGLELIRTLREGPDTADLPVMMITATDDRSLRCQALESGASDVLGKPLDGTEVLARTRNMLAIRRGQRLLAERSTLLEAEVRRATAEITAREQETILRLSRAAEYRDWETGTHIVRVAWYARITARELGMSEADQEILFRAAPMHDVGKIGVPDYILLKPGALDEAEFDIMKQHTVIGHRILGGSSSELLRVAAEVALTHHERWDGTGYPQQLRGSRIPISGRIVAVADSYDALTSRRPYKSGWPSELAWQFLGANAGTRFDPDCVSAFRRGRADVDAARESFPEDHPSEPRDRVVEKAE